MSSSLYPELYDRLPNDTDLSVFKDRGMAGMNFAFVGGLPHYHTPLDNFDNLDMGSLQHQGEQFLSMAKALSRSRVDELPEGADSPDAEMAHLVSRLSRPMLTRSTSPSLRLT